MPVAQVCFMYVETSNKWEVIIAGVVDELEAKQAFNAVVLTVTREPIDIGLYHKVTPVLDKFHLIPAVA